MHWILNKKERYYLSPIKDFHLSPVKDFHLSPIKDFQLFSAEKVNYKLFQTTSINWWCCPTLPTFCIWNHFMASEIKDWTHKALHNTPTTMHLAFECHSAFEWQACHINRNFIVYVGCLVIRKGFLFWGLCFGLIFHHFEYFFHPHCPWLYFVQCSIGPLLVRTGHSLVHLHFVASLKPLCKLHLVLCSYLCICLPD